MNDLVTWLRAFWAGMDTAARLVLPRAAVGFAALIILITIIGVIQK